MTRTRGHPSPHRGSKKLSANKLRADFSFPRTPTQGVEYRGEGWTPARSTSATSCSTGSAVWEIYRESAVLQEKGSAYRGKSGRSTGSVFLILVRVRADSPPSHRRFSKSQPLTALEEGVGVHLPCVLQHLRFLLLCLSCLCQIESSQEWETLAKPLWYCSTPPFAWQHSSHLYAMLL